MGFSTKNFVTKVEQIPDWWYYVYYGGWDKELVLSMPSKIHSPLRVEDTPSFGLFSANGIIFWKDFVLGGGDGVEFAKVYFSVKGIDYSYPELCSRIRKDFNDWLSTGNVLEFCTKVEYTRKKFVKASYKTREWNKYDADYWMPYKFTSSLLKSELVLPFSEYTLISQIGDQEIKKHFRGEWKYGFFTKEGKLYKIYQPKVKDYKYITVDVDHIEGKDWCTGKKYRAILSGKKDRLALSLLDLEIDTFASNSENSYLTKKQLDDLNPDFTLMDSDEAGIKSSLYYYEKYGIPYVYLGIEKDIADSIKTFGISKTRDHLVPRIQEVLEKKEIKKYSNPTLW